MTMQSDVVDALPTVEAELNYLAAMDARPRNYASDPPLGLPRSNVTPEAHQVFVRDFRPILCAVALEEFGFAVTSEPSALDDFDDEDAIRGTYYDQSVELLKQATGGSRVFIFDHTLRRRIPGFEGDRKKGPRQPVQRVHIDHTAKSGPQRVRDLLPDEAEELLQRRVQVINLWRPIRGPVYDSPLAVCDARSVSFGDLVPTDLVYPHRIGETYSVTYNPDHRWFYLSEMQTDEALLIKCYDSLDDGRARFTPHSAFVNSAAPAEAPPRESIEIRAFVFHDA